MDARPLEPPELSDGVITLRRPTEADVELFLACFDDEPGLQDALGYRERPTREKLLEGARTRDTGVELVARDAEGEYVGDIAVEHVSWDNCRAELGLHTRRAARGRGVATRMVLLVTEWLFSQGFLRVQMTTLPGNQALHGVARRAGFEREGVLRSYYVERRGPTDAVMFSKINPNWSSE